MNNKFDELTKNMAQSVTRRGALKKFGLGLAGMALACFGLANQAKGANGGCRGSGQKCGTLHNSKGCLYCCSGWYNCSFATGICYCT
jgi:hypothetical protein